MDGRCTVSTPIGRAFLGTDPSAYLECMRTTPSFRTLTPRIATTTAAGLIALLLASCSVAATPSSPSGVEDATCDQPTDIVIQLGDRVLRATPADTSVADQFLQALPMVLDLRDPMGQAMSGPLPGEPMAVADNELVLDPAEGGVYYAPDSHTIALYYADLGQTVPPPGWALIAELTPSGVTNLADADAMCR